MDNQILFRASSAGQLLSEPKLKADKEAGKLSETAKTLVESMWLEREFGYREFINNEYMVQQQNINKNLLSILYTC